MFSTTQSRTAIIKIIFEIMKKLIIAFILLSFCSQAQEIDKKLPPGAGIKTHSHLISISGGCFTVWVGVFWSDGVEETLLTSGETTIGNGCRPSSSNNSNLFCKNDYYKGDYIQNSNTNEYKYCLIDCLKDERVYESYQIEKNEILNQIKK
jgi:hypothetical protein